MTAKGREMFGRVSWMLPVDEAIIRLLAEPYALELTPGDVAHNIGYERSHVQRRVSEMVRLGVLDRIKEEGTTARYGVTDLGQRIADQEVTVDELEELTSE